MNGKSCTYSGHIYSVGICEGNSIKVLCPLRELNEVSIVCL